MPQDMRISAQRITALIVSLVTIFLSPLSLALAEAKDESGKKEVGSGNPEGSKRANKAGEDLWSKHGGAIQTAMEEKDLSKADEIARVMMDEARASGDHLALSIAFAAQGWLCQKKQKTNEAVSSFRVSLEEDRKYRANMNSNGATGSFFESTSEWLADCYYELRQYEKGLELENDLIAFGEKEKCSSADQANHYLMRADFHSELGNYAQACEDAKEAIRLNLFKSWSQSGSRLIGALDTIKNCRKKLGSPDSQEYLRDLIEDVRSVSGEDDHLDLIRDRNLMKPNPLGFESTFFDAPGELFEALSREDMDRASGTVDELRRTAKKHGSHIEMAAALSARGALETHTNELRSAVSSFKSALHELERDRLNHSDEHYARVRRSLIVTEVASRQGKEALRLALEMLSDDRLSKKTDDVLAQDLYLASECNMLQSNYTLAQQEAVEACTLLLLLEHPNKQSKNLLVCSLDALARAQLMLAQLNEAARTTRLAMNIAAESNINPANSLPGVLAAVLVADGKHVQAERILQLILPDFIDRDDTQHMIVLSYLAQIQSERGDFEAAAETYAKAIEKLDELKGNEAKSYAVPLYYYQTLALEHCLKFDEAKICCRKAFESKADDQIETAAWRYMALAQYNRICHQMGEFDQAEKARTQFTTWRKNQLQSLLAGPIKNIPVKDPADSKLGGMMICSEKHLSNVDEQLVSDVLTGLRHFPEKAITALKEFGVLIAINPRNDLKSVQSMQPRGYAPGSTFDQASCFSEPRFLTVFIAEQYADRSGAIHRTKDGSYSVCHELGHLLNFYWMNFSDNPEFIATYEEDKKNSSPGGNQDLSYLLQPGTGGRDETFADLVALTCGTMDDTRAKKEREQFPRSLRMVQNCLFSHF